VEYLLKKHKVPVVPGRARIAAPGRIEVLPPRQEGAATADDSRLAEVDAGRIIVATGAGPRSIPGIAIDRVNVISSTEAMTLAEVPESIVVVGAGAVGVEFAWFFNAVGSKVTLLEMLPSILPGEDAEITKLLARSFRKQGIEIMTSAKVAAVDVSGGSISVRVETEKGEKEYTASKVLMAIGVSPNTDALGLEEIGVRLSRGGFIEVDDHMMTSAEGVYAIGDVAGPPLLAHVASAEGILAVETIAGRSPEPLRRENMPRCVYCQPQVASVGLSEEAARQRAETQGRRVTAGTFPFRASGKSVASGEREGLFKIVADPETGEVLGASAIGSEVTELVAEVTLAIQLGATIEQIHRTVQAHPTLSEAVMEAAGDALGESIHKPADVLGRRPS